MGEDPFAILGLPRVFHVEQGVLRRAYLERSARAHPDLSGGEGDGGASAAALNRARETLEDPERRARALLELLAGEAGVRFEKADERALPEGFLAEMMRVREQMEGDRASGDAAKMAAWERWAEERRGEHGANVAALFEAFDSTRDVAALRKIRLELNAWRYVERMIEQME